MTAVGGTTSRQYRAVVSTATPTAAEPAAEDRSAAPRSGVVALGAPPTWVAVTLIIVVAAVAALVIEARLTHREGPPGEGSVDVGFLSDMTAHHNQAVQMSFT